jgi:hypothetical protein
MAHTSGAVIYGFNVTLPSGIKQHASRDKVINPPLQSHI